MPPLKKVRRRALALAIFAGFAAPGSQAAENNALEDAVISDMTALNQGTIQLVSDEETAAPVPVAEPAEPMPVESPAASVDISEISAPVSSSCNCCSTPCCTKTQKSAATAAMKGAYKGVFYANDFSYLNDRCYDGPSFIGDCLKGLCCDRVDLGGEARIRYHDERGMRGLGLTGRDDTFYLTRYRAFANWRVNDIFRVYGEYLYADSAGEKFNNRPIEENRGELQNLFLDTALTDSLFLRLGRQELLFADQRLISPLDWANTRRTFQGVRGTYRGSEWTVDGFFVNPMERTAENEDRIDPANTDVKFYGVYGTKAKTAIGSLDTYYLGLTNNAASFDYHTIGSRVVGATDGGQLYAFEGGYQFGSNSPGYGSHSAGFFTGGLGRQLELCTAMGKWTPSLWFWYDWASGGDQVPAARGDNGFDHLFPLAHKYNGFMDLFGRRNLNDVNVQFNTPILGPRLKMLLWYHYLFLDQKTTPYGVTMAPYNPDNRAGDRELGHEIDLAFTGTINPRTTVVVGYSHFYAGKYYKTTPGVQSQDDADFFWTQFQWRF